MNEERRKQIYLALVQAVERLRKTALEPPEPEAALGPLGETLYWIVLLDQWYWDLSNNTAPRISYTDVRDHPKSAGRAVYGHRFAQNQLKHYYVLRLPKGEGGFSFPRTFPFTMHPHYLVWRPLDEILTPGQDRVESGADQYEQYLQGKQVGETIAEVLRFFQTEAMRWYSHLPTP